MLKLFKLALEEIVAEEPVGTGSIDVSEAVANAEELARTDVEIQQDIQAVEELMEEKQVLEEQVNVNDQLLNNPDAVVTAADVEVSEECRNEVYYSLGYKSGVDKIRLSSESMYKEIKSNPRKYLQISNESIKDTIKKIWEKIKEIFKKMVNKIKSVFTKSKLVAQGKIEEQKLDKLNEEIKSINVEDMKTVKLSAASMERLYSCNPYSAGFIKYVDIKDIKSMLDPDKAKTFCDTLIKLLDDIYKYVQSKLKLKLWPLKSDILIFIKDAFDVMEITDNIFSLVFGNPANTMFGNAAYTRELLNYLNKNTEEFNVDEVLCVFYATKGTVVYIPKIDPDKSTGERFIKSANFKSNPIYGIEDTELKFGIKDMRQIIEICKTACDVNVEIGKYIDLNVTKKLPTSFDTLEKLLTGLGENIPDFWAPEAIEEANQAAIVIKNLCADIINPNRMTHILMNIIKTRQAIAETIELAINEIKDNANIGRKQ